VYFDRDSSLGASSDPRIKQLKRSESATQTLVGGREVSGEGRARPRSVKTSDVVDSSTIKFKS